MKKTLTIIILFICLLVSAQEKIKSGTIKLINNEEITFKDLYFTDDKVYYFNTELQKDEFVYIHSYESIKLPNGEFIKQNQIEKSTFLSSNIEEIVKIQTPVLPALTYYSPNKISLGDTPLKPFQVKEQMLTQPLALDLYTKGKNQRTFADIFLVVGVITIGMNAVRNMNISSDDRYDEYEESDEKGTPIPYFIGGGLIVASVPLYSSGKKNIKSSIDKYNSDNSSTSVKLKLLSNSEGLGIALQF